ncbi:arginyltransferase [Candidatus Puniceispirillum sp.]|nr:arginyltransferase [Candidatus Puniceispirillum sp.]
MNQDKRLHRKIPLAMRISMQSNCPYLRGQTEQRIAVDISNDPQCHDGLAAAGFRRVENWVYRPACPKCNACLPWRVDVTNFKPSRNMSRITKKNRDLTRHIASPSPSDDHYRLFKTYVTSRHDDGQMAQMDQYDFTSMISNSPIETMLISYNDAENNLVGAILSDLQSDGLSAVYSFFEPGLTTRSLGTFMVLDLLGIAKGSDLDWLYLGYFVKGSQKMEYKARFRPAEIFKDGRWQAVSKLGDEIAVPRSKTNRRSP